MNRALSAIIRAIDMSEKAFFIVVEGKETDPVYYERLISGLIDSNLIKIIVPRVYSDNKDIGGKELLKKLWRLVATNRSSRFTFKGKKKAIIFALDKDVDELFGDILNEDCIIYTKSYCVENELFLNGCIETALSAIMSVPINEISDIKIRQKINLNISNNLNRIVIALCCRKHGIGGKYGYSSQWDVGVIPDDVLMIISLQYKIDHELLEDDFQKYKNLIDGLVKREGIDIVFKGKWYFDLVKTTLRQESLGNYGSVTPALLKSNLFHTVNLSNHLNHISEKIKSSTDYVLP